MSAEFKTLPYSSQCFACTASFVVVVVVVLTEKTYAFVQNFTETWCNFQVADQIQPCHPKCAFDEVSVSLTLELLAEPL